MLIFPAIDIKNGKCVRLTQGRFDAVTTYSDDPAVMANKWAADGAKWLHVVDLDGAKNGEFVNRDAVKKIRKAVKIPIQVGGGINSEKIVKELVGMGINRLIIGTVAVENKSLLQKLLKKYSSQIAVSLDAKEGKLMLKGWQKGTKINAVDAAVELQKMGVERIIFTDVTKDGTLTVPNYEEIKELLNSVSIPVIAAGGISSIEALNKLNHIGVEGAIVGKALYEGKINLKEVLGEIPPTPL